MTLSGGEPQTGSLGWGWCLPSLLHLQYQQGISGADGVAGGVEQAGDDFPFGNIVPSG